MRLPVESSGVPPYLSALDLTYTQYAERCVNKFLQSACPQLFFAEAVVFLIIIVYRLYFVTFALYNER